MFRGKSGKFMIFGLLIVLLLAACSSKNNNSGNSGNNGAASSGQENKDLKFSYVAYSPHILDTQNSFQIGQILSESGVDVEFIDGGNRDQNYFTNVDLRMASGDLPDAMVMQADQMAVYGAQGALMDWKPLIDQYAPHIKQYLDENEAVRNYISEPDGKIYGLVFQVPKGVNAVWMFRKDIFDKLNLKVPTTIEEFTDTLRALKNANPTGQSSFYPLTGELTDIMRALQYTFGFDAQLPGADGKITGNYSPSDGGGFDKLSPGYQEFLKTMKMWTDEGLLDVETANDAVGEDQVKEKMLNGNSVVFAGGIATRVDGFTTLGQQLNPEYQLNAMPPLKNINDGSQHYAMQPYFVSHSFTTISAKSPNAEAVAKFFDFLFSDEGKTLKAWGVEGKTYEVVDGKKQFTKEYLDRTTPDPGQSDPYYMLCYGCFSFTMPADDDAYLASLDPFLAEQIGIVFPYMQEKPVVRLNQDLTKQISDYSEVGNVADKWLVGFISGKEDLANWDTYVKELNDAGYTKVQEIQQKAFDGLSGK